MILKYEGKYINFFRVANFTASFLCNNALYVCHFIII